MKAVSDWLDAILTAANLAQSIVIAVMLGVAWLGSRLTLRWYVPRPEAGIKVPGLLLEAAVVIAPYLAALVVGGRRQVDHRGRLAHRPRCSTMPCASRWR